jgi:hypothetical protein
MGFFTMNPTKFGLHFSDFYTIFYAIYKNQQKHRTITDTLLQQGPWKFSIPYRKALGLWKGPRK